VVLRSRERHGLMMHAVTGGHRAAAIPSCLFSSMTITMFIADGPLVDLGAWKAVCRRSYRMYYFILYCRALFMFFLFLPLYFGVELSCVVVVRRRTANNSARSVFYRNERYVTAAAGGGAGGSRQKKEKTIKSFELFSGLNNDMICGENTKPLSCWRLLLLTTFVDSVASDQHIAPCSCSACCRTLRALFFREENILCPSSACHIISGRILRTPLFTLPVR